MYKILFLQEDLLTKDMEGMLIIVQQEMPNRIEEQPEPLFEVAYSLKYNAKKMKRYIIVVTQCSFCITSNMSCSCVT